MLVFVNSREEAERYPVIFGDAVPMIDDEKNILYIKSVDAFGKTKWKIFDIIERPEEKPLTAENCVTRPEFDALTAQINQLAQSVETLVYSIGGAKNGESEAIRKQPESKR